MEHNKFDVTVIGAGIIGANVALELQRQGAKVLLIDKGKPGAGCSFANAGWVTPAFAMPLAQPGMFLKSIRWLLDPDSPLHIKPAPSLSLAKWLLSFTRAMNQKQMEESVKVLAELSKYSLDFYAALAARSSTAIGFEKKGLLLVSAEEAGVRYAQLELRLMEAAGIRGTAMGRDELLAAEPALKPLVKGGVLFPDEAHLEPHQATLAVHDEFVRAGGECWFECPIQGFQTNERAIEKVVTPKGRITPGLVVLAAGTWTRELAEQLGCSIPLLGGKGYSMNVRSTGNDPRRPIMIVEKKIAITPRANGLRIAGTLELVNQDFSHRARKVKAIHQGAKDYLHLNEEEAATDLWCGLRPCTPDGVPLIGFSGRVRNLFYSVGHQMLGLQTAPGSAKLAAELIGMKPTFVDPRPFRPERYER